MNILSKAASKAVEALGFEPAQKQLDNPPLASRLGENFCRTCVWPIKITIENYNHADWNAIHHLDPSKQVEGRRLEFGYSSSGLELAQKEVKKQQQVVAKGGAAAKKKTFQIPEQILVISYSKFDGTNYQHVAEYYKLGGQDAYGNFGFNQHGEFIRIQKNAHTTPIVALDDPQMPNVVAFGYQEWKHWGIDVIRKNTLQQVAIFPLGLLLSLVMAANKAEPTVFPLDVLQKQAAASALRSAAPRARLGSPAANTSFKQLVGHSPPDDPEQREADLTAALLQSTQKEKKATEELEGTTVQARCVFLLCLAFFLLCCRVHCDSNLSFFSFVLCCSSLGNALENLSLDAIQRGKNEGKLADAILIGERRKVEQNGLEGGDAEDSKKPAVVTKAKQKSAPATVVKLKRTAGTWVGITVAGRDLHEKERVLIRSVGGSNTAYAGSSGLAVRNLTGSRPAIALDTDAEGNPIQPKKTKNLDKKFIFVQEEP